MTEDRPHQLAFALEARRRRLEAGLAQAELARRINYTAPYLCKIESGDRLPTPELAELLDEALGAGGLLADLARPRTEPDTFGESWTTRVATRGTIDFDAGSAGYPSSLTWSLPVAWPEMTGAALPFLNTVFAQARAMGQRNMST